VDKRALCTAAASQRGEVPRFPHRVSMVIQPKTNLPARAARASIANPGKVREVGAMLGKGVRYTAPAPERPRTFRREPIFSAFWGEIDERIEVP
jgi:hypothetical protein